jgi:RimJ/RimL family protein N-acetyltransferase
MGTPRPPSGAELGRRAERADHDRLSGRGLSLTIVETGDDTCIGQVDVHRVDWDHGRAELGLWVAPARRGVGVARRALVLAGAWLLLEAGLERLELLTQTDNHALQKSAQAAGFQFEGVLRGYFRAFEGLPRRYHRGPDARVDMAVLSLVRRDLRG